MPSRSTTCRARREPALITVTVQMTRAQAVALSTAAVVVTTAADPSTVNAAEHAVRLVRTAAAAAGRRAGDKVAAA